MQSINFNNRYKKFRIIIFLAKDLDFCRERITFKINIYIQYLNMASSPYPVLLLVTHLICLQTLHEVLKPFFQFPEMTSLENMNEVIGGTHYTFTQ